jgi:hypothetical protein
MNNVVEARVRVMIDHDEDGGVYNIRIKIPHGHGTYEDLKRNILTWGCGSAALNALDIARTIINMETDYSIGSSKDTSPLVGNGD